MEALGEHLRKAREEKGITLEQIGRITKINLSYLRILEEEQYHLLPAPIFVIGFLKQYAQCVGLDPEDVVLRYRLATQQQGDASAKRSFDKGWLLRKRSLSISVLTIFGLLLLPCYCFW